MTELASSVATCVAEGVVESNQVPNPQHPANELFWTTYGPYLQQYSQTQSIKDAFNAFFWSVDSFLPRIRCLSTTILEPLVTPLVCSMAGPGISITTTEPAPQHNLGYGIPIDGGYFSRDIGSTGISSTDNCVMFCVANQYSTSTGGVWMQAFTEGGVGNECMGAYDGGFMSSFWDNGYDELSIANPDGPFVFCATGRYLADTHIAVTVQSAGAPTILTNESTPQNSLSPSTFSWLTSMLGFNAMFVGLGDISHDEAATLGMSLRELATAIQSL